MPETVDVPIADAMSSAETSRTRSLVGALGIVHFGLGPIGRLIAELVRERPDLRSAAAIDIEPALHGQPLDAVLALATRRRLPPVVGRLADADLGDTRIAIHCTSSSLRAVMPQLVELVDAGLNVVSTCEELSYPWAFDPKRAAQLDRRAKASGVSVLGTGINPGFSMDYMPVVLSGVLRYVDRVRVVRAQDAAMRRLALQRKVGVGMGLDDFRAGVDRGELGHVGLRQSADALAAAFGWRFNTYTESVRPVVARRPIAAASGMIAAGRAAGLRQVARGAVASVVVVELDLTLAAGIRRPFDRVTLFGDRTVEMRIPGGLHGDAGTAAIVVNSIWRVLEAPAGLMTMVDVAPPHPSRRKLRRGTQGAERERP